MTDERRLSNQSNQQKAMKKFLRIAGIFLTLVILAVLIGRFIFARTFPKVSSAKVITVEATTERVERGRYLANHVMVCIDCHSTRNYNYYAGPLTPGTEGKGGDVFNEDMGLPGTVYAKNITPTGIGNWTDGEILKAFTTGVSKDGSCIFPIMPYPLYASMDEDDAFAIVAYLRQLKPIVNDVPPSKLNFPMNFIVKTIPHDATPQKRPSASDTLAYGKYLFTMAGCGECHTPLVKQNGPPQKMAGMDNAGGYEFRVPWGLLRSANITPDSATGIGSWPRDRFIGKFKRYASEQGKQIAMKPPYNKTLFNTIMPWTMYAGMTEEDLTAIYKYLQTFKPVHHAVEKYSDEGAAW
jgi:mono/diheme cytochrome c family protein